MGGIEQFDTFDVAPDQRRRYWNDLAERRFAGSQVDAAYSEFKGHMLSWNLGQLGMLRPHTNPCRVTRTPLPGHEERLILHLQNRGKGHYSQAGKSTRLEPGDAVLCSTGVPYTIDLTRHETLVVEFPRHLLADRVADLDDRLVTRLAGTSPALRIFHDFLLSLWQQGYREEHHPGWDQEIGSVFIDLLAMAMRGAEYRQIGQPQPALAQRVRDIVEARLQDPHFTVSSIARDCNLSVRAVQMVFSAMGTTPSAYIQQRRLARAAEKMLSHPEATITQIAFDYGFNDSAYFTRCFRRHNGLTPREFRIRN